MSEAMRVEETRQRVISMILEARARIEGAVEGAREIRSRGDLDSTRKEQALEEVVTPARTRTTQLVRDAREGVRGGWHVGAGGIGLPVRPWDRGLSEQGLAARDAMLGYVDAAARVFAVDLEELETGEAPTSEAVTKRDAAAAEVAAYEDAHPESVVGARDRVSMSR